MKFCPLEETWFYICVFICNYAPLVEFLSLYYAIDIKMYARKIEFTDDNAADANRFVRAANTVLR